MWARTDLWEPWASNRPGSPGPRRVAKEIAMIDILPIGRVVCGFVRGIDLLGQEAIPALKAY